MINKNIPEYTVTELSHALKGVVEASFDQILVKGEISRIFVAQSGHAYISLKDENAVLDTICFKNVFEKINIIPEQGLEVTCKGRMSTFAKKSSYQLIISEINPAGVGALMAMLEARKMKLNKAGFFDENKKKKLPFLPDVVGVITSMKGAVIQDILHRFKERFPRNILIWPTLVQGENASSEIIKAIKGFNNLEETDKVNKPDLIIIARGGGSIEDLWCFNDEELVITVSNSSIPIISAIGHETDTTLIDLAADVRAPTPTAAAEIAVPVRLDLYDKVKSLNARLLTGISRKLREVNVEINSAKRGLISPNKNIENFMQRLDFSCSKLITAIKQKISSYNDDIRSKRIDSKDIVWNISHKVNSLKFAEKSLIKTLNANLFTYENELSILSSNLSKNLILNRINSNVNKLNYFKKIINSLSYKNTLNRGFALVKSYKDKKPISSIEYAKKEKDLEIEFYDGNIQVRLHNGVESHEVEKEKKGKNYPKKNNQGKLF